MSLTLDLKPEEETTLREYATAEGMTPDRFIVRLLDGYQPKPVQTIAEPDWKARLRVSQKRIEAARLASGISDEEMESDIDAAVKAYRKERAAQEASP